MINKNFEKINLGFVLLVVAFVSIITLLKGFYPLFLLLETSFLGFSWFIFKKGAFDKRGILYKPLLMNVSGILLAIVIYFFEEYRTILVLVWLALYWTLSSGISKGQSL